VIVLLIAVGTVDAHRALSREEIEKLTKGEHERYLQGSAAIGLDRVDPALNAVALRRHLLTQLKATGATDDDLAKLLEDSGLGIHPELGSLGVKKSLTVLIDFPDRTAKQYEGNIEPGAVAMNIYGEGTETARRNNRPYESLRAYYRRASNDRLHLEGNVLGWRRMSRNRAEYRPEGNSTVESREWNQAYFDLALEALAPLEAEHDFRQYDNDDDGDIDLLVMIYAGHPIPTSFWWNYRLEFESNLENMRTFDGKKLKQFIVVNLERRVPNDYYPRSLIHEFGHALGLPDLYDRDENEGDDGGVGTLDMMDRSRGNHNAFSRWLLGWIEPKIIAPGESVRQELVAGKAGNAVAVFPGLETPEDADQEIFFIENRHPIDNDGGAAEMPGNGLLVWHVDATIDEAAKLFVRNNSTTTPKLVRLVRADDDGDFSTGGKADAGTYFVEGSEFSEASTAKSFGYKRIPTGVTLKEIGPPAETITALVGMDGDAAARYVSAGVDLGPEGTGRGEQQTARGKALDIDALLELLRSLESADQQELGRRWRERRADPLDELQTRTEAKIVIAEWAGKNGGEARDALLALSDDRFKREAFPLVMRAWAHNDPGGAARWYRSEEGTSTRNTHRLTAGALSTREMYRWQGGKDYTGAVESLSLLDQGAELAGALAALRFAGSLKRELRRAIKSAGAEDDEVRAARLHTARRCLRSLEGQLPDRFSPAGWASITCAGAR
jgi:M6 family metalloprotease-like protein